MTYRSPRTSHRIGYYCWIKLIQHRSEIPSTYSIPDAIYIKGGVDDECIVIDIIPDITATTTRIDRVSWKRKKAGWRVFQVLIYIPSVIALRSLLL